MKTLLKNIPGRTIFALIAAFTLTVSVQAHSLVLIGTEYLTDYISGDPYEAYVGYYQNPLPDTQTVYVKTEVSYSTATEHWTSVDYSPREVAPGEVIRLELNQLTYSSPEYPVWWRQHLSESIVN